MMRYLVSTALVSLLAIVPAAAQQQQPQDQQQPQAQQQQQQQMDQQQQVQQQQNGAFRFLTAQEPRDWSTEALTGRTVENPQGENLGDINNVIIDEDGRVKAVIIGVGGFLGIGQKDVGVPFDALQFQVRADDRAMGVPPAGPAQQPAAPQAQQPAPGQQAQPQQPADQQAQQQPPAQTGQQQMAVRDDRAARYDAEHRNVMIILNATREQLENAPEFAWLDDQTGDAWGTGGQQQPAPAQQRPAPAPRQPAQ